MLGSMKRGVKTTIAGGLLLVAAVIVPIAVMVPTIADQADNQLEIFDVPGETEIRVEEPGVHYLWLHVDQSNPPPSIPGHLPEGMKIEVTDDRGQSLTLNHNMTASHEGLNVSMHSIGSLRFDRPTTIKIDVSESPRPMQLSFSKLDITGIVKGVFGAIAIGGVLGLAGIGVLVWGIVKLASGNRPPAPPPGYAS